jgi:hypothetical protein
MEFENKAVGFDGPTQAPLDREQHRTEDRRLALAAWSA